MIPQKKCNSRKLTEFYDFFTLHTDLIKQISDAYLELLELPENSQTAKAEQFLLDELYDNCETLSTRLLRERSDKVINLDKNK